jgi:hypothetical protein
MTRIAVDCDGDAPSTQNFIKDRKKDKILTQKLFNMVRCVKKIG